MLCYAVLCCGGLCHAVLWGAVLCCGWLCYAVRVGPFLQEGQLRIALLLALQALRPLARLA
jgi:hypothetical protein